MVEPDKKQADDNQQGTVHPLPPSLPPSTEGSCDEISSPKPSPDVGEEGERLHQQSERVVLCATRGGPASYLNQDAAIALAKARGQDIVFINVTNMKFLDKVSSAILVDMDEQMEELGEFLLLMAKERAERAGVRARIEVRTGPFCRALIDAVRIHHADVVVFGQPGESGSLFRTKQLQQLGECLRKDTGVEVMLL